MGTPSPNRKLYPKLRGARNAEPDLLDLFGRSEPFQVNEVPINTHFSVIVDEEFDSVRQFEDIVRCLDQARPGDIFEIKLSTNGGALFSVLPLLAAIENTNAKVYVHAISDVASAGTFLLLAADDVCLNPYVTIMFHQEQFGSGGQGSSVESYVTHTRKASKVLMETLYGDFLTDEEINEMRNGKDFYMDKEEFETRYIQRCKIRTERLEDKLKAEVAAAEKKAARKTRKKVDVIKTEE